MKKQAQRISLGTWAHWDSRAVSLHIRKFWVHWASALLCFAVAMAGFSVGIDRLLDRWLATFDDRYAHGFLALAMTSWLIYRAAVEEGVSSIRPSPVGFAGLVIVVFLYAINQQIDFTLGMQVLLPLLGLAILASLFGAEFLRIAWLPIALLYFAIPIWDIFIPHLQRLAVAVVSMLLRAAEIQAFVEGNRVALVAGTFEIAEGCAGVVFLVVGMTLAAFFGILWFREWRYRAILFALAASASIAANWIRIFLLIVIGERTEMTHTLVTGSHEAFGWIVFGVCFAPVMIVASRVRSSETSVGESAECRNRLNRENAQHFSGRVAIAAILIAAIVFLPKMIQSEADSSPASGTFEFVSLGDPVTSASRSEWAPEFEGANYSGVRAYRFNAQHVDLFFAYYLSQRPGAKLISNRNDLFGEWQVIDRSQLDAEIEDELLAVQMVRMRQGSVERMVLYWYFVAGSSTSDEGMAKVLEIIGLLMGRRDGAVVAISMECELNCTWAQNELLALLGNKGSDFLEEISSLINTH